MVRRHAANTRQGNSMIPRRHIQLTLEACSNNLRGQLHIPRRYVVKAQKVLGTQLGGMLGQGKRYVSLGSEACCKQWLVVSDQLRVVSCEIVHLFGLVCITIFRSQVQHNCGNAKHPWDFPPACAYQHPWLRLAQPPGLGQAIFTSCVIPHLRSGGDSFCCRTYQYSAPYGAVEMIF